MNNLLPYDINERRQQSCSYDEKQAFKILNEFFWFDFLGAKQKVTRSAERNNCS